MASLLALHSLSDFDGEKRDFFLRTLTEYISSEGLIYCVVHDQNGQSLLSLVPQGLASKIPNEVQTRAIYTMGLKKQSFQIAGHENPIFEFAKPIFENGHKTGIVRLGFMAEPLSLFSMERISLLAMIALFIFAAVSIVYYGTASLLKPLKNLYQGHTGSLSHGSPAPCGIQKKSGTVRIIEELEQSFLKLKETLKRAELDNAEMTTKLGVTSFEKKQIIRIIDSLNFGLIITDIQGNISYINNYTLKIFELKEGDAIDHPVSKVLPNEGLQSFIDKHGVVGRSMNNSHIETQFPDLAPGKMFRVALSYLRKEPLRAK
ncbi:MAG: PAS domain-containing protein [Pseudomonadota bacterium]